MKINKILVVATLFIAFASNAQISKGNWMMGGSGAFGNSKVTSIGAEDTGFYLNLYPNVGYFFIDKLAVGTNASLVMAFQQKSTSAWGIGPYVRYYFLEKEKAINVFSELSYYAERRNDTDDLKFNNYNIKAGTVFFLNSSVGIEVALNYLNLSTNQDFENERFYLGVGFQIHLERE
ncbi:MAG: hypothetical protein ACOVOV_02090 [Dolichospermum sp.]